MSVREMFYDNSKEFSAAEERLFAKEDLVYNVTEDLLVAMENREVNKKELARRLGKSQSHITQLLSGARNMTLRTLSDIAYALGADVKIKITAACIHSEKSDWQVLNGQMGKVIDLMHHQRISMASPRVWNDVRKVAVNE